MFCGMTEGEGKIFLYLFNIKIDTAAQQYSAAGWSQELHLDVSSRWQGPEHLGSSADFTSIREEDQKWSSRNDSSQNSGF